MPTSPNISVGSSASFFARTEASKRIVTGRNRDTPAEPAKSFEPPATNISVVAADPSDRLGCMM